MYFVKICKCSGFLRSCWHFKSDIWTHHCIHILSSSACNFALCSNSILQPWSKVWPCSDCKQALKRCKKHFSSTRFPPSAPARQWQCQIYCHFVYLWLAMHASSCILYVVSNTLFNSAVLCSFRLLLVNICSQKIFTSFKFLSSFLPCAKIPLEFCDVLLDVDVQKPTKCYDWYSYCH